MEEINRPLDLLNNNKGKKITILTKDKRKIEGILTAFDLNINIVLKNAVETTGTDKLEYGSAFIKGDIVSEIYSNENKN